MTDYCTCGTLLVENARFCHRCGRPTRELTAEETPPPVPEPVPVRTETLGQLPVSFRNPLALRVAFVMSLATMLLFMVPFLNLLIAVWWLGAGWAASVTYTRITGTALTTGAGAHLGFITGVLTFISMTITGILQVAVSGKQFQEEMVKQSPQVAELVRDPMAFAVMMLFSVALIGAIIVGICAAGGALGAKSGRGRMSQTGA